MMEYYITTPADYWIAQNAVSITLNALGDKNRIQGSVASGSVIMCFVESIKAENAGGEQGNGEGLWYGSNHEPKRWPLSLSPTYFNSDTHKYVYVAIPRSASVGSQAIIVFPSEQLDIYGRAIRSTDDSSDDSSDGVEDTYIQVGSTNYFYVWLNGIISAPRFNPETNKEERAWEDPIGDREWGLLETAQGREEQFGSGKWYTWSAVNQVVTFLKKIVMSPASWFQNLIIGSGTTQGNLNGVAKQGITTQQNGWDSHIVTPEYLDEFGNTRYLRKDQDDSTPHTLTMGGAVVTGNTELRGNTIFGSGSVPFIPDSSGYGYIENQGGHFLQVENLKVLGKMEAKEVEIQEVNYVGGSIVLTPANGIKAITSVEHDTTNSRYKLYYNTVDSEGNEVKNTWQVGDLAYSERWDIKTGSSGPLENHLWWRKVVAVGDGYITVSDVSGEKLAGSDVPEVGDKVVMLGNTSDTTRQNAIILSSSQQYAPYIRVYTGVHTFELPEYELQLKPGDNLLSGRVRFQDGTNGRIEEVLYKATYGKGNIVRNTAFRGDYLSRLIEDGEVVEADDTMFNPSLKYWTTSNATVQTDNLCASGVSCVLASGSMAQTLLYPLVAGEKYVVTFRAKGTSLKLNVGSETARTISLTNAYKAYTEVFTIGTASDAFSITNANCTICEIQMERGEIPSTWHVSPYDNNSDLAAIQDLQYLADAMKDYTDIDGGLVLTRQIRLGEHNVNGQIEDFTEHAGANGAYASDNSVAFWGGGTLEQAIRAVSAYVNNETYQPTAQELANMAKFVVTHGGRAILNDVILRGYIYALGGVFKGELEAATGTFKGFLRSLFEHASVVETQASANKYNLSGDHCNLIVDRGNEYVLPCADAHIGKRIVLVDAVENSDSNTYVTVSTANSTGIIGFLGDDVNKSTSANPSKLMFINGTMEFICTKVGNPAVIRWVLISNQTAWSKSSDSIFKDVDARPLLCYYGLLNIEAMTATASDTVGITEYYKRDGIRLSAMRVSMSNDDKGRCIVTVYFPVSTTWNQNAILTVMGMGYDNTSSHRATYATIEALSYGDDATLGAVINTANFSGFTNGKFFIKVEYLGE